MRELGGRGGGGGGGGVALTSRGQGIRVIVKMQADAGDVSKATWRRGWRKTSEAGAEHVWAHLSAWMTS